MLRKMISARKADRVNAEVVHALGIKTLGEELVNNYVEAVAIVDGEGKLVRVAYHDQNLGLILEELKQMNQQLKLIEDKL